MKIHKFENKKYIYYSIKTREDNLIPMSMIIALVLVLYTSKLNWISIIFQSIFLIYVYSYFYMPPARIKIGIDRINKTLFSSEEPDTTFKFNSITQIYLKNEDNLMGIFVKGGGFDEVIFHEKQSRPVLELAEFVIKEIKDSYDIEIYLLKTGTNELSSK